MRVKSKLLTAAEDAAADHQPLPLSDHFAAYATHLEAKGVTPAHRKVKHVYLTKLAEECGFKTLPSLTRGAPESWTALKTQTGVSARTANAHLKAAKAFANWCVDSGRLPTNPFARVPAADENADRRRQRRAIPEADLTKLLEAAQRRPLVEAMTVRRGQRKGSSVAKRSHPSQKANGQMRARARFSRSRQKSSPRRILSGWGDDAR